MNKMIPKSHQKLIDEYNEKSFCYNSAQKRLKHFEELQAEYNKEYDQYQKTGILNKEFAEKLFNSYKNMLSMNINLERNNMSYFSTESLKKELQEKGYNIK